MKWFAYLLYVISGDEMRDHPGFLTGVRRGLIVGHALFVPPCLTLFATHILFHWP